MFNLVTQEVDLNFLEELKKHATSIINLDESARRIVSNNRLTEEMMEQWMRDPCFKFDLPDAKGMSFSVIVMMFKNHVRSFYLIKDDTRHPTGFNSTMPLAPFTYPKRLRDERGSDRAIDPAHLIILDLKRAFYGDFLSGYEKAVKYPESSIPYFSYWKKRVQHITQFHNNAGFFYYDNALLTVHNALSVTAYKSPTSPFKVSFFQATERQPQIEIVIRRVTSEGLGANTDPNNPSLGRKHAYTYQQPKFRYLNGTLEFAEMLCTGLHHAAQVLLIGSKEGAALINAGMTFDPIDDILDWAEQGLECAVTNRRASYRGRRAKLLKEYKNKALT